MALATRLNDLGTETAFAVSLAAAEWAAEGNWVYPFHLGDINLATPQNIVEAMNRAIADGKTGYCPAAGIPALRESLAADIAAARGIQLGPDNIVVQPGGKPVITKFIQSVMNPGDGVLVLTDMFGGTPSNIALSFLDEHQVEVVTGLNLPMLIKLATLRETKSLEDLAAFIKLYGQRNISVASELLPDQDP